MAQAALSYQQPQRRTRELEQPLPPLRVLPGRAPSQAQQASLASLLRALFTFGIITVIVVGMLSLLRVGLADATMAVLADSEQISQTIEAQRSEGARLEMQYSIASSPSAIQEAASQLGMAPDPQVDYLRVASGE